MPVNLFVVSFKRSSMTIWQIKFLASGKMLDEKIETTLIALH